MNKIEFKQTSNIFINTGIVALYRYLKKYASRFPEKYIIIQNELQENKLIVECDNLLPLLEDVYYFMGSEIYDTVTTKQIEEAKNNKANFYYEKEKDKFYSFPKINTYGLTHLLTNNAQGNTRNEENSDKIKKIENNKPELALKIKTHFEINKVKLLSKVYFNEPYTKITRLAVNVDCLSEGKQKCPILNESFNKLVEGKNISPFIGGLSNFNSFLNSSDKKISWKALYLIRFSPGLAFYHYKNGYDTLICNFFDSNNLQNINLFYNPELYKSKIELEQQKPLPYNSNFNFFNFSYTKKDEESYSIDSSSDAIYTSEISFLLLYTFYNRNFKTEISKGTTVKKNIPDPFSNHPLEKIPISIITFKAESFASTMRPNEYEEFNNIKFIFRLIYKLEHNEIEENKVLIKDVWYGLKIKTPRSNALKFDKSRSEERKIRAKVFGYLLKGKSIINEIEKLFYNSYKYKIENFDVGYRNYKTLLNFLLIYEQSLKINIMDKELQQKAINLGKSIGQGILRFNNEDRKTNAKAGRKYLIGLHKSRTLLQFMDNLYRVANKYSVSTSNEILENIDEDNFQLIRQFVLISALNQINSVL